MEAVVLLLLSVCGCDSVRVEGHTRQDVTLPCKYDRKYHGALSACWQRGEIPNSGCYNPLISTDGDKVLTRASSRFQLLGRLEDGDVSLTIKSLTDRDAGRYGCRVEIPGWFNDDKHHIERRHRCVYRVRVPFSFQPGPWNQQKTAINGWKDPVWRTRVKELDGVRITAVQLVDHLEIFIGNSVRLTFIIFMPAMLMTAVHSLFHHESKL